MRVDDDDTGLTLFVIRGDGHLASCRIGSDAHLEGLCIDIGQFRNIRQDVGVQTVGHQFTRDSPNRVAGVFTIRAAILAAHAVGVVGVALVDIGRIELIEHVDVTIGKIVVETVVPYHSHASRAPSCPTMWPCTILRLTSSGIGATGFPSGLIGELPHGVPNNLMPFITQTAIGIRQQLSVFGDDYDTPDGTCIRDYIHVVDLAKSHVSALERLLNGKGKANFEVFNIGTGNGFSVMEVIKSFEKMSGVKLNYRIAGRREGDIVKIWADTTLSNKELGWKAEQTLDDMTRDAWNWEQKLNERK